MCESVNASDVRWNINVSTLRVCGEQFFVIAASKCMFSNLGHSGTAMINSGMYF